MSIALNHNNGALYDTQQQKLGTVLIYLPLGLGKDQDLASQ